MKYILFMIMTFDESTRGAHDVNASGRYSGASLQTQEFNTKKACMAAGKRAHKKVVELGRLKARFSYFCARKGE